MICNSEDVHVDGEVQNGLRFQWVFGVFRVFWEKEGVGGFWRFWGFGVLMGFRVFKVVRSDALVARNTVCRSL